LRSKRYFRVFLVLLQYPSPSSGFACPTAFSLFSQARNRFAARRDSVVEGTPFCQERFSVFPSFLSVSRIRHSPFDFFWTTFFGIAPTPLVFLSSSSSGRVFSAPFSVIGYQILRAALHLRNSSLPLLSPLSCLRTGTSLEIEFPSFLIWPSSLLITFLREGQGRWRL